MEDSNGLEVGKNGTSLMKEREKQVWNQKAFSILNYL